MSEPAQRTPLAVGLEWSSRVTALGLEFALPTLGGLWLDRRAGSAPWATLIGAALGFAVGMAHLLRIARNTPGPPSPNVPLSERTERPPRPPTF